LTRGSKGGGREKRAYNLMGGRAVHLFTWEDPHQDDTKKVKQSFAWSERKRACFVKRIDEKGRGREKKSAALPHQISVPR